MSKSIKRGKPRKSSTLQYFLVYQPPIYNTNTVFLSSIKHSVRIRTFMMQLENNIFRTEKYFHDRLIIQNVRQDFSKRYIAKM
jgi:hypothetical protein